jgi:hypothetical protein
MWKQLDDYEVIRNGDLFFKKEMIPTDPLLKGVTRGHPYIGFQANSPHFYNQWRVWRRFNAPDFLDDEIDNVLDNAKAVANLNRRRLPGNRFLASPLPLP